MGGPAPACAALEEGRQLIVGASAPHGTVAQPVHNFARTDLPAASCADRAATRRPCWSGWSPPPLPIWWLASGWAPTPQAPSRSPPATIRSACATRWRLLITAASPLSMLPRADHPQATRPRWRPHREPSSLADGADPRGARPPHPQLRRAPHAGGSLQTRDHPLAQALRRPATLSPPLSRHSGPLAGARNIATYLIR